MIRELQTIMFTEYIKTKKEPLDAVPLVRFKMGLNQRPPD